MTLGARDWSRRPNFMGVTLGVLKTPNHSHKNSLGRVFSVSFLDISIVKVPKKWAIV